MHSFTPVFRDFVRPWHIGMLYNRDARLAHALLDLIRADGLFVVGDNEPYSVSDGTDYSVPVHGERRGLPHIEIEVRQDLVESEAGQREWAAHLAKWLVRAAAIAQLV
jgi:predicted N-formylglutamate amidohydrolase